MSALITALGAMGSAALGAMLNKSATDSANQQNMRNWREMAEYNSPFNQVKRLRKAGINPAMALQNGAVEAGNASSPPEATQFPTYDFSPSAQVLGQSAELYQAKRLQDAQIKNTDANTQNQMLRNKTQLLRDLAEFTDKMQNANLSEAQRENYKWLAETARKEYENYDQRFGADMAFIDAQTNYNQAHADYLQSQKEYQDILNKFAPEQQQKITSNLEKQGKEIESAIRRNDADAAHSAALKALSDAQKEGVDMENDIKESMADYIVDEQAAKADEQFWKSQETAKTYRQGSAVSNLVPGNNPNGTIGYQSNGYVRHHVKWSRSKRKK